MTTTTPTPATATARSPIATGAFWAGLAERAGSTFAGALLATLGASSAGILSVDWPAALSVAALAAVVSILKAFAAPGFTAGLPAAQVEPPAAPPRAATWDVFDHGYEVTRKDPPADTAP